MRPAILQKGLRHVGLTGLLVCVSLGGASAVAARATPGEPVTSGNVEVSYSSPDKFTEFEWNPNERSNWLDQLSDYVAKRASRSLPPGQKLSVTITDVQLAGVYEPWHRRDLGQTRIVRASNPPRIDLRFKLEGPTGELIKEGNRQLRDLDFLNRTTYHRDEPLSHEKNLIDSWLAQDFAANTK